MVFVFVRKWESIELEVNLWVILKGKTYTIYRNFELLKENITFKAINKQKNKIKRHNERWNYKNTKE